MGFNDVSFSPIYRLFRTLTCKIHIHGVGLRQSKYLTRIEVEVRSKRLPSYASRPSPLNTYTKPLIP